MPEFSIVIPTLARADTLRHAMATVLAQSDRDFELVVQNNGLDPETTEVATGFGDERVRHFGTEDVLSMSDNWEAALGHTRGRWVTFLGDDDGLLPDACAIARMVDDGQHELIAWSPFLYLWPQYQEIARRNVLEATVDLRFTSNGVLTRPLLEQFYAFEVHYARLPMIYNSFVARRLIDRVRAEHGRYFLGSLPDVATGVINARYAERFRRLSRPLSVSGISGHSTGHRLLAPAHPDPVSAQDFPLFHEGTPLPGARENLEACIAEDMRHLHDVVVRDPEVAFSGKGLVKAVAAAANRTPEHYDATVRLVAELAAHLGVDAAQVEVPPRAEPEPEWRGMRRLGPETVLYMTDGDVLSWATIADAVALSSQLVPQADALERSAPLDVREGAPLLDGDVSFGAADTGAAALLSGWSQPEEWGTWSLGASSVLRFAVEAPYTELRIDFDCRAIPLPDGRLRRISAFGGRERVELEMSPSMDWGRFELEAVADAAGIVKIELRNDPVVSPAELGLSADDRPLGVGLERAMIVPTGDPPA